MIQPAIVYGFQSSEILEGGDAFEIGVTSVPGIPIYFVNKSTIVAYNQTLNEEFYSFNCFANKHGKVPGFIMALIGSDIVPQFKKTQFDEYTNDELFDMIVEMCATKTTGAWKYEKHPCEYSDKNEYYYIVGNKFIKLNRKSLIDDYCMLLNW